MTSLSAAIADAVAQRCLMRFLKNGGDGVYVRNASMMDRKGSSKVNEKYYTGLCMLCHDIKKVRHINLYVVGSEGFYICKECETDILLPFIRDVIAKRMLRKKEAFKKARDKTEVQNARNTRKAME